MIESIQDWLSNIPGDWLKDEQLECPPEFRKEENVLVYPELSKYILARLAPGGLTTQDPIKDPVLPVLIEDVKDPSGQVNQDPGRVPQVFIEGLKDSRESIEDTPSQLAEDPPLPVLAEDVKDPGLLVDQELQVGLESLEKMDSPEDLRSCEYGYGLLPKDQYDDAAFILKVEEDVLTGEHFFIA